MKIPQAGKSKYKQAYLILLCFKYTMSFMHGQGKEKSK